MNTPRLAHLVIIPKPYVPAIWHTAGPQHLQRVLSMATPRDRKTVRVEVAKS